MKIIVLIGGGRTGIDFFQSLLDSHSSISQFPGTFYFDEFWLKVKNIDTIQDVAKKFIQDYEKFFDSRLNLIERHYMLGEKKDSFYIVEKKIFIQKFVDLMKSKKMDKENLLHCLHLAYSFASGENLTEKKIIILHLHHVFRIKILDGIDFEIIYTVRDPLASYTSLINHWLNFEEGTHVNPSTYYFHIDRLFNGLKNSIIYQKNTHVIQLEKLHIENEKVMKAFCKIFNIIYNETMTQSTYHGKLWWGDKLSGKDLNGVNPYFKNKVDINLFFKKDIECMETFLGKFIKKYEYPLRSKGLKYSILKIFPFKVELLILKRSILSLNIKNVLLFFLFWFKRVRLMSKKIHEGIEFPKSMTSI